MSPALLGRALLGKAQLGAGATSAAVSSLTTGTLIPAKADLVAVIGADFSTTITLYTDLAQTNRFDLTGFTVLLSIGGRTPFTLTSGAGLTVIPASGVIVAALTAAQTATITPSTSVGVRYSLKLTDGAGVVSYPIKGSIVFADPNLG